MKPSPFALTVAMLLGSAMFAGCKENKTQVAPPPPTPLTVSQPVQQQVADFVEFTGKTVAFDSVDVRARVKGFLKNIAFVDGARVKEGDLLYEIEPDIYQAEYDKATASLQAAQARLDKAKADLSIKQEMAAGNAASKLDVIVAQSNVYTATAEVAMATALIEQAKINLGYTKVYAPISGRIDRSRVDAGNLVGADGNTLLANIVQARPIYVYFDVDELTIQRYQARMLKQGVEIGSSAAKTKGPISMALGMNPDFPYSGVIDYVDNKVDSSTGTVQVRGKLDNADYSIAPGFFARVRVPDGDPYTALLIPERAIGVDQGQKYVLVVNDANVVQFRPIETGSQHGRLRVVKKGLAASDWIITEGILRTRPGATVAPQQKPITPEESEMTPASSAPATTPATRSQP